MPQKLKLNQNLKYIPGGHHDESIMMAQLFATSRQKKALEKRF
jgi:hypothetical protein